MVKVQKIRVPDTGHLSWIVIDGTLLFRRSSERVPVYLHRPGRSPNTALLQAHHLCVATGFPGRAEA